MTANRIVDVGEGFWNVRGSFRIGGVLDIGTHASLVRRRSGKYLLLDACGLDAATRRRIDEETGGGEGIEAMIHLHPFHSVFVRPLHELYPRAKLYGTARHHRLHPDLPWQSERTEDVDLHRLFADDLEFMVPRGVDFLPANEKLHFSSVLAFHGASRTLHVDDTLCYVRMPGLLRSLKEDWLGFHPSLARVLQRRPGAVRDFRGWAAELVDRSRSTDNLCAAHGGALLGRDARGGSLHTRLEAAVHAIDRTLDAHERRHG